MPLRASVAFASLLLSAGCQTMTPPPSVVRAQSPDTHNEMVLVTDAPGPEAYAFLFERILDVIDDDFAIAFASRYDGRIETHPRLAPGLEQFFKEGSPDLHERLLASLQTYRHRCLVVLQPVERGYLINVTVLKELEDLPQPTRERGGGAAFRSDANVDRRLDLVDPAVISNVWIPKGRDYAYEQKILRKIRWRVR
jgi:hypothetical protein